MYSQQLEKRNMKTLVVTNRHNIHDFTLLTHDFIKLMLSNQRFADIKFTTIENQQIFHIEKVNETKLDFCYMKNCVYWLRFWRATYFKIDFII